ncbi:MAG: hypothetical protein WKF33_03755 [Thermoleophilaceae bacterium]
MCDRPLQERLLPLGGGGGFHPDSVGERALHPVDDALELAAHFEIPRTQNLPPGGLQLGIHAAITRNISGDLFVPVGT